MGTGMHRIIGNTAGAIDTATYAMHFAHRRYIAPVGLSAVHGLAGSAEPFPGVARLPGAICLSWPEKAKLTGWYGSAGPQHPGRLEDGRCRRRA